MMTEEVDITAYRLDEAVNILTRKGIKFILNTTTPPLAVSNVPGTKEFFPQNYRVVKQVRLPDGSITLTIAPVSPNCAK